LHHLHYGRCGLLQDASIVLRLLLHLHAMRLLLLRHAEQHAGLLRRLLEQISRFAAARSRRYVY
jgi:hypothetical protein